MENNTMIYYSVFGQNLTFSCTRMEITQSGFEFHDDLGLIAFVPNTYIIISISEEQFKES